MPRVPAPPRRRTRAARAHRVDRSLVRGARLQLQPRGLAVVLPVRHVVAVTPSTQRRPPSSGPCCGRSARRSAPSWAARRPTCSSSPSPRGSTTSTSTYVPRRADLPEAYRGTKVFGLLGSDTRTSWRPSAWTSSPSRSEPSSCVGPRIVACGRSQARAAPSKTAEGGVMGDGAARERKPRQCACSDLDASRRSATTRDAGDDGALRGRDMSTPSLVTDSTAMLLLLAGRARRMLRRASTSVSNRARRSRPPVTSVAG